MSTVVRKSWVKYFWPSIRLVLYVALALFVYARLDYVQQNFALPALSEFGWDNRLAPSLALLVLVPFALVIARRIYRFFVLRSHRLTISDKGVYFESGVLPWTKHERFWKYDQIYEALYRMDKRFLGWLFRFGSLVIVGREGATREYVLSGMHNPRAISELINRHAKFGG